MGFRRLRPFAGIGVALAATAGLAGCAGTTPADTVSSSSASSPAAESTTRAAGDASSATAAPTATMAPRTANWTALQAGDCLADAPPTDPAVVMVTLVDCSQPHLAEAYLRRAIPVDAALDGTANNQCQTAFTEYTGRSPAGSPYTTTYLIDSDQDRTSNNPLPSTVICLLQGAQGQSLTGSARG
jgi:hypothetical protein